MISIVVASAVSLLFLQGAVNAPRQSLISCLKQAAETAKAQKIAAAQYGDFAKQNCGAHAEKFKNALISFDMKNGVGKRQASADAQVQVDDFFTMSAEKYEYRTKTADAAE